MKETESKNWITSETMHQAALILEDFESFMTTTIAVRIPEDTPAKALRILEQSGAIRTFQMNTGYETGTYFAIAVR